MTTFTNSNGGGCGCNFQGGDDKPCGTCGHTGGDDCGGSCGTK